MHEHESKPINETSLREGWETVDMRPNLIVIVMMGIGVMMFGACLTIIFVMRGFDAAHITQSSAEPSPVARSGPFVEGYTGPVIEIDPRAERDAYLKEIKHKLNSYGMVNEQAGAERARIPIEEAMKRVATGQVPYKKQPQKALLN